MNDRIFYTPTATEAMGFAAEGLIRRGWTQAAEPGTDVTDLLLGVPCRQTDEELTTLLERLPPQVRIFGGFLDRPVLRPYRCFDLLTDPVYLARNAMITAYGAIEKAQSAMKVTWEDCPVLIVGGGRIGQCLAQLLKGLGAQVVIALRRSSQQALLGALGYETEGMEFPHYILGQFRVIFNTVPAPVLSRAALEHCRKDCLKIELASSPGMEGEDIIQAKGLPGGCAPESSGRLIAQTVSRLHCRKEASP